MDPVSERECYFANKEKDPVSRMGVPVSEWGTSVSHRGGLLLPARTTLPRDNALWCSVYTKLKHLHVLKVSGLNRSKIKRW